MKLLFITNNPIIALGAEQAGVDRIFVDLETIGKSDRQGGMDTVQSSHTVEDVRNMRRILTKSELFVRVNQIYPGSQAEIDAVIEAGADVIMLPYFKTVAQVEAFLQYVNGRVKTCLLFETPESVSIVREILALDGIDECYIGLNDLHLGYGQTFLFEPLANGTVDEIAHEFIVAGKPFGFGGIARSGEGMLSADVVLAEHIRLGSSMVILSRAFCDVRTTPEAECGQVFAVEVAKLRAAEQSYRTQSAEFFRNNHIELQQIVERIVENQA